MRRNLLVCLFLTAILLAPAAAAERGGGREAARDAMPEAARAQGFDGHPHGDGVNATRNREARDADALDSEGQNRARGIGRLMGDLLERYHALRITFQQKAADVREACRAEAPNDDATGEETRSWAHCIRDGLRELRHDWKMQRSELRGEWAHELSAARAQRAAAHAE